MIFTDEKIKELSEATDKLYEKQKGEHERNKNIIFIYCPPKVGSTSLVSSIRLFACEKFTIHHLHDDNPIQFITNNDKITTLDIIKYNNYIGKNVWVIDIYRTPLERKMSEFFESLNSLHFNVGVPKLKEYTVERLSKRFNDIFKHISNDDYYKERYDITFPDSFDFSKNYILNEKDGIKYIKLRLQDSHLWGKILTELLGTEIKIIKEYMTEKKQIGDLYKKFKNHYVLPLNYLEEIRNEMSFMYYNDERERDDYINKIKTGEIYNGFTKEEYNLYRDISIENSKGITIIQGHYIDQGCLCEKCSNKRKALRGKIHNGMVLEEKIWHNDLVTEKMKKNMNLFRAMKIRNQQILFKKFMIAKKMRKMRVKM